MKNSGFTKKSKFGIEWINKIEPFWLKWPKTPKNQPNTPFLSFSFKSAQHLLFNGMQYDHIRETSIFVNFQGTGRFGKIPPYK